MEVGDVGRGCRACFVTLHLKFAIKSIWGLVKLDPERSESSNGMIAAGFADLFAASHTTLFADTHSKLSCLDRTSTCIALCHGNQTDQHTFPCPALNHLCSGFSQHSPYSPAAVWHHQQPSATYQSAYYLAGVKTCLS